MAALLPLVAGLGIWILGELKQYNEGYQAIAQRDALKEEKKELQQQKDSLNLEVATLLQLKAHYVAEADHLRRDTQAKQATIDKTYLRGIFTRAEAMYSLDHVKGMGPAPDLDQVSEHIKQLPESERQKLNDVLARYEFSMDVIEMSRAIIAEFDEALRLMPASEWTRELQPMPSGAVIADRKIMSTKPGKGQRHYDITEGRFLTEKEVEMTGR